MCFRVYLFAYKLFYKTAPLTNDITYHTLLPNLVHMVIMLQLAALRHFDAKLRSC
jgi:hypothetical protein